MFAFITTAANGRLTDDSTCAIAGMSAPVPARRENTGILAPARIIAAIRGLGYKPASNYYDDLTVVEGGVRVAVKTD